MNRLALFLSVILFICPTWFAAAFVVAPSLTPLRRVATNLADGAVDDADLVARRIIVIGDVQGGYYRSCVKNEASRFRRLVGTMSPPDDGDEAEIYIEGKEKMVDSFIRWVKRGNVGLSQVTTVKTVIEEDPTGLFDGFYVKMQ
mmetsp:Transcript_30419/g.50201  ORF Transcript_30419/g.50201 Transcript_30419/m.50201 type:complete len:144 (+) Transcript_30419:214-645(+)|eukprot:CAMPEP_0119018796 /NCGR_PEP_ID=MMETSP1176-20130426/20254_1 /TAXON_ID=265551 /ORGANISM="Synedropsis recta cf, Strain CCMP1620" /LENGTH=143 /DNA_ID=CAMNT_0006972875 /DNA_START=195 /DNA_END=626 /DNA_ORIENTATION=+